MTRGCAFCTELLEISRTRAAGPEYNAAVTALFDRATRAARLHHQYRARRRMRRFR